MQSTINDFLRAAEAMADAMIAEAQAQNPTLVAKVANGLTSGEDLMVAFVVGENPAIELLSRNDYGTARTVAKIPAVVPKGRKH